MPITTGKFPAKINSFNCSNNNFGFSFGNHYSKKGSRFLIAAFLLLITAFLSSACETPGSIGEEIISDDEPVKSQTVYIQDYTVSEENSFSGRLANTGVGYFEDPVYGTMKSVALLKPSISTSDIDMIGLQDTLALKLIFNPPVYGDSLATSTYEIYEAAEIWRGTELRFNDEIPVDMTNKIAEFQVEAGEDSIVVDLSRDFMVRFSEFFNADTSLSSAQRDSIYINNFPGIAIVPSEANRNIRFLKTLTDEGGTTTDDENQSITSFLLKSPNQDEDEEDGPQELPVRDWGMSFTRQSEPDYPDNIVMHNSERVLKLNLNIPKDELETKSIVNAQLVFSKNNTPVQGNPVIKRPNTNLVRAHIFDEEPNDVMAEIFTTQPNVSTSLNDTSNAFYMDITQHVLNEVFGDTEDRFLYVSIQSVNGLIYSSHFFDPNSADVNKPRVVITYVEE
ncbi:MAG: hypothetical protein R3220_02705 [Balneolaceae bacterium]|nr:hypothetical protein [Balneolaceae bacterium]